MKWQNIGGFCIVLALSLQSYGWGQDVNQTPLLLIPEILKNLDTSINILETNTINSAKTIMTLQSQVKDMQSTINLQRSQLNQASTNYQDMAQAQSEKLIEYENTLKSLQGSLTQLSKDNQEKDQLILSLTRKNHNQFKVIIILGGILATIIGCIIIKIYKIIQTGGLSGIFKNLL